MWTGFHESNEVDLIFNQYAEPFIVHMNGSYTFLSSWGCYCLIHCTLFNPRICLSSLFLSVKNGFAALPCLMRMPLCFAWWTSDFKGPFMFYDTSVGFSAAFGKSVLSRLNLGYLFSCLPRHRFSFFCSTRISDACSKFFSMFPNRCDPHTYAETCKRAIVLQYFSYIHDLQQVLGHHYGVSKFVVHHGCN